MSLFHSWINPKLEVRNMRPDCKGIFAKEPLTKDERLAIFGGHVMRVLDEPEFLDGTSDLALQIDEQFVIGTAHENELEDTDYFNHSCNPNAGFKGQIFLVAMSLVAAGAEVTFDYAMVIHESAG
ncbi:MAG: SET domain-containing protein, partial [Deltaproteobacteria bacterium]|nr:SET domain-containing protein [Deltaproteobacteria bacterium]